MIVQRLKAPVEDEYLRAEKYYTILSAVNGLSLTTREIQLVAYTAIRGNMSYTPIKKDFCERFGSSLPTIANMTSKLRRLNMFIRTDMKIIKVNPIILLDFKKDIQLEIKLMRNEG